MNGVVDTDVQDKEESEQNNNCYTPKKMEYWNLMRDLKKGHADEKLDCVMPDML